MGLFFVGGVLSTVLVEDGDLGIFFRFQSHDFGF